MSSSTPTVVVRGGELHVVLGPMFSGKSSNVARIIRRFCAVHTRVLAVNHLLDTRTHDYVQTHDADRVPAIKVSQLKEVLQHPKYASAEVVAIDEGQFYEDLCEVVLRMVNQDGKKVWVASLDGDFEAHAFGGILHLIPEADSCIKLTALCYLCKAPAAFTKRVRSIGGDYIQVGGAGQYVASCRQHRHHDDESIPGPTVPLQIDG